MKQPYNVVIIGGGPAGCATAIALRKLGVERILVAESSNYSQPRIGESIPPDTRRLFSKLGILESFENENHETCMGSQSSWGASVLGYNDFLFNPQGTGWHLDRLRFDRFMANQARLSGVEFIAERPFRHLLKNDDKQAFCLEFSNGEVIKSRFVVDASGRGSKLARRLGAKRKEEDALLCIAGYIKWEDIADTSQLNRMTFLEAVEYGWWYAARLPENNIIFAIASSPKIVEQMNLTNQQRWSEALLQTQHLSALFDTSVSPTHLKSWFAPSTILDPPSGAGWIAVGDAASTFDPISSQGIYKALQHSLEAAPAIVAWLNGKQQGLLDYRQFIGNQFIEYLQQREYFYNREQRWLDSEFWSARQSINDAELIG